MALPLNTLEYAQKLRDAGFTARQAEGQAHALADAMTNSLVTNETLDAFRSHVDSRFAFVDAHFQDVDRRFRVIDQRFDAMDQRFVAMDQRFDAMDQRFDAMGQRFDALEKRFVAIDRRFDDFDKQLDHRFAESLAQTDGRLAHLERRMTLRLLAGITVLAALVRLL